MLNSIRLGKALLAALVAAVLPMGAHAQTWPTQTVRFVVPTPAGSSVDIVARLVAEKLGGMLGQTVIVDNKGGAGGTIGADAVAKARDGHTFLLAYNGPITVAPSMFPKLPYDPQRDFAPVILAVTQPNVLAVRTDLKVNSVKELVALAKNRPGKIDYASVGNGSLSHLAMELLKMKSDTFLLHIPFNGGPAASLALGRGDVQVLFAALSNVQPLLRDGKVKLLAVSNAKRSAALPDLPTIAEQGLPGLRRDHVEWLPRAGRHAEGSGAAIEQGHRQDPGNPRSEAEAAGRRGGSRGRIARTVCRAAQERDGGMDGGDRAFRHQA